MRAGSGWIAACGLALVFLTTPLARAQPPEMVASPRVHRVVEKGKGWYLLELAPALPGTGENPLVWLVGPDGLGSVPLTPGQIADLEREFAGEALVDEGGKPEEPPAWVMLDKRLIDAIEAGTLPPGYEPFLEPDTSLGGCPDRNKERHIPVDESFDSESRTWDLGSGFTGTLSATLPAQIDADLYLRYKEKRTGIFGACVTNGFSFRNARIVGTATVDGVSSLEAAVTYQAELHKAWTLMEEQLAHVDFWVGPVYVWLDFDFKLDVGVDLDFEVTGNVTTESRIHATGSFDYTCTRDSCTGTNTFDGDDFVFDDVDAGIEARLDAQVWAKPMLGGELWSNPFVTILRGEVGLRGYLEADLWGYYGSTCGDADGNGSNETVKGLAADLQWGYDVVYNYELLDDREEHSDPHGPYFLGWWDLLDRLGQGKSTALQPMLVGPAEVVAGSEAQEYTVRMRPCYPYSEAVTFAINGPWTGSTSIPEPQSTDPARNSSVMSRVFSNPGTHTTTVTNTVDGKGRAIQVPYTRNIEAALDDPDIKVTLVGSQTSIPRNSTLNVGSTPFGQVLPTGIALRNVGGEMLQIVAVSVTGSQFEVTPPSTTQVPAGGLASFTLRLLATQPGTASGVLTITSNDPDESPYLINVTGLVGNPPPAPEIRIRPVGGAAIPDGGSYAFAPTPVGNLPLTVTFEVWNDGNASLIVQNPTTLVSGTGFTQFGNAPATAIAPGTYTTFQVRFQTATPWHYSGAVTLNNNDANEGQYDIALSAAALGSCVADASTLCLRGGRFKVKLDHAGGAAQPRTHTDLGGFFSFNDTANLEVGVKVLQPPGGPWWVFHGPATHQQYTLNVFDLQTGNLRTYVKPQGSFCGNADTGAFPSLVEGGEEKAASNAGDDAFPFGGAALRFGAESGLANCTAGSTAVCLNADRFKVEVLRSGVAKPAVELTALTGVFSFDNPQNPEVFVKVLGPVDGHYWVYYGSLSNQAFTIRVTDTGVTPNLVATYDNPAGNYCGGSDTGTF